MKQYLFTFFISAISVIAFSQTDTLQPKKRLDFAKTYFELGGMYTPSFDGKRLSNGNVETFKNSASIGQYLNWGAFHFWGHAEIYVSLPLKRIFVDENEKTSFKYNYSVVTGARYYPWAFEEKKIRPYIGLSWSGIDFQQKSNPIENQPTLSKDFLLVPDLGVVYGYKDFVLRLAINYVSDNEWKYPISKTAFETIKTPNFNINFGLLYTMESSHVKDEHINDRWNGYPTVSKLNYAEDKFGAFFIGVGPSSSFSLSSSKYNQKNFPYLKDKLTSKLFFDVAVGYHFYKPGLFAALSFRNPKFDTEAYGTKQEIKKLSLAFEINKYLTDYTGFAPYVGVNIAYDKLKYRENIDGLTRTFNFKKMEPGITLGWDIIPGKLDEIAILRTNLRWYPSSSFNIDGFDFKFNQLEYNLIQAVFYPDRLLKKRNKNKIS